MSHGLVPLGFTPYKPIPGPVQPRVPSGDPEKDLIDQALEEAKQGKYLAEPMAPSSSIGLFDPGTMKYITQDQGKFSSEPSSQLMKSIESLGQSYNPKESKPDQILPNEFEGMNYQEIADQMQSRSPIYKSPDVNTDILFESNLNLNKDRTAQRMQSEADSDIRQMNKSNSLDLARGLEEYYLQSVLPNETGIAPSPRWDYSGGGYGWRKGTQPNPYAPLPTLSSEQQEIIRKIRSGEINDISQIPK